MLNPLLTFSPLFPLIFPIARNLEYEYSLLLTAFVVPILLIMGYKAEPIRRPTIPLAGLIILGLLAYCSCSRPALSFWLLFNSAPSLFFGYFLYRIQLRSNQLGKSKLKTLLAIGAMLLLLTLAFILTLWFSPQKRGLFLPLGFMHGPVYDFLILMNWDLAIARIGQSIGILGFFVWFIKDQSKLGIAFLSMSLTCVIYTHDKPSTSHGLTSLQQNLPNKLIHSDFTLYYQNKLHEKTAAEVYRQAEFHSKEIKEALQLEDPPHVHIFAYSDSDTKKLWFGGGATDVTDVVTPSIHILLSNGYLYSLRHELVHAMTSKHAFHGLGFHPNIALTEGLAVALAPQKGQIPVDIGAAYIITKGHISSIAQLFSPAFWIQPSKHAYTVAASFTNYVLAEYGAEKLMSIYNGQSFHKATGVDLKIASDNWKEKITKDFQPEAYGLLAERLYRNLGVFKAACPHAKKILNEPSDVFFMNIRQPFGYETETDYWPWLLKIEDKRHDLQTTYQVQQLKKKLKQGFDLHTAAKELNTYRKNKLNYLEDVQIALFESDLLSESTQRQESIELLNQLYTLSQQKALGASLARAIEARFKIEQLDQLKEPQKIQWRSYLARRHKLPKERPDTWIIQYLVLRNLGGKLGTQGLDQIKNMLPPENLKEQTFTSEWFRLLSGSFQQLNRPVDALSNLKKARDSAPLAFQAYYAERVRYSLAFSAKTTL